MSALSDRVMYDEAFQAACQRYHHSGGSSGAIAQAALRASNIQPLIEVLERVAALQSAAHFIRFDSPLWAEVEAVMEKVTAA
jgi:hypothetical protein